ncbi:hypothetical protein ILYODFUR_022111, partial [Ilyodon furcidens]
GDRTVNHVQDKGISKGHRPLQRIWDGKGQQYESQSWYHNSPRSFANQSGANGYLMGPGQRYVTWQYNVSNNLVRTAYWKGHIFSIYSFFSVSVSKEILG